jgi:hypothetical protein
LPITRDNHFVPQLYLKNFASSSSKVHEYRTLVSRSSIPQWKTVDVAGTAYETNLYTRIVQGEEADDIEQWLNRDFETPAIEALQNVLCDRELTQRDWYLLVRLLASQIVRTPAFLVQNFKRWTEETKQALIECHSGLEDRLREAKTKGFEFATRGRPQQSYIPIRTEIVDSPDPKKKQVVTTVLIGRGHWFQSMRQVLTSTVKVLHQHTWFTIEAPNGLPWFTSDDPVICLNYNSPSDYNFKGGWGIPRTNILFPLSPRYLMFTQVGESSRPRLKRHHARVLREIIAKHAYRRIYSSQRDEKVPVLRSRNVDERQFQQERLAWRNWYQIQNEAERQFWHEPKQSELSSKCLDNRRSIL